MIGRHLIKEQVREILNLGKQRLLMKAMKNAKNIGEGIATDGEHKITVRTIKVGHERKKSSALACDYFGNPIQLNDEITYVGVSGHTPKFKEGRVISIDTDRKYKDIVQVLGEGNSRTGWTYPKRIIVKKYIKTY